MDEKYYLLSSFCYSFSLYIFIFKTKSLFNISDKEIKIIKQINKKKERKKINKINQK